MIPLLTAYATGWAIIAWAKWNIDGRLTALDVLDAACWPVGIPWAIVRESRRRRRALKRAAEEQDNGR